MVEIEKIWLVIIQIKVDNRAQSNNKISKKDLIMKSCEHVKLENYTI